MAGTKDGGRSARDTNYKKTSITLQGQHIDIEPGTMYAVIGAVGGRMGHTGGFYANRELAAVAGAKGGRLGRRGKMTKEARARAAARRQAHKEFQEGFSVR